MKRNHKVLAIVLAMVLLISSLAFGIMIRNEEEGDGDYTLEVGYFLKYNITDNSTKLCNDITMTITQVNETELIYRGAWDMEWAIPTNQSFFFFNLTYLIEDYHANVTNVGTEIVSFPWGGRGVEHYYVSIDAIERSFEVWLRNGVMVKMLQNDMVYILLDSNMPQVR